MAQDVLKNYYFDINKIMDFVINSENDATGTEISEMYGVNDEGGLALISKQISENKNAKNDSNIAIRYDLIKTMSSFIYGITEESEMTVGEKLCLSTFIENKFISSKD